MIEITLNDNNMRELAKTDLLFYESFAVVHSLAEKSF